MHDIVINEEIKIGIDHPPFFIAEAGINHNGEISIAKKLIDLAAKVGVESIKFQKRDFSNTITSEYLNRKYSQYNSFGKTYLAHKIALEFSDAELTELAEYSTDKGLIFACSAFDINSFDFIEKKLDPLFHKIPSPLTVNHDLLKHVASYGKPMFISTGMTSQNEVDMMMDLLEPYKAQIVLLQCTSLYPTDNEEVNLNTIKAFQDRYNVLSGFSSHDRSVVFPAAAIALGARVIEKHITLDRAMKGPDHASSFEERGLDMSNSYTKDVFKALGSEEKEILNREKDNRVKHLQSYVTREYIHAGTLITDDMIILKSPGTGFLGYMKNDLIGKSAVSDIPKDTTLLPNHIK